MGEYAHGVCTQGGCLDAKANPEITLEQVADKAGELPLPLFRELASWLNWESGGGRLKSESTY